MTLRGSMLRPCLGVCAESVNVILAMLVAIASRCNRFLVFILKFSSARPV